MQREYHSAWIGSDGRIQTQGDDSALFPWWSFTKTVIAVCALRLVEQGRLVLDEQLPGKPYTLRHLLQHRAGVPDYGGIAAYHEAVARGEPAWSKQKLVETVEPERLRFEPGEGWSYSNLGYLFVRDLIEERSGRSFAAVISQFVCEPLGLRTVSLASARSDFEVVHWTGMRGYDPRWVYHGCLLGTAPEAARVLHAVVSGTLLGRDLLDAMLARHPLGGPIEGWPWSSTGYGLGVMSGEMESVGRVMGHSGGGPHVSTRSITFRTCAHRQRSRALPMAVTRASPNSRPLGLRRGRPPPFSPVCDRHRQRASGGSCRHQPPLQGDVHETACDADDEGQAAAGPQDMPRRSEKKAQEAAQAVGCSDKRRDQREDEQPAEIEAGGRPQAQLQAV